MSGRSDGDASLEALRLLRMVSELHGLGYQRLRVIPGMSPSGLHWRCAITPASNVLGPHGLEEGPAHRLVARYTTGERSKYFGWSDAERAEPVGLAQLFVERFPEIAREAAGQDPGYARWLVEAIAIAGHGFLPFAYSDFGDEPLERMRLTSPVADAGSTPALRPPPTPMVAPAKEIEIDPSTTRNRVQRLRRYVASTLLNEDGFICPALEQCRSSMKPGDVLREGTMSHVGKRFDLRVNGRALRIVVVGQESGWPKDPALQHLARQVSMEDRYRHIHDTTGLSRRYYTEPGHQGRSPHMRGTTSALRVMLGSGLGADYAGEFVYPLRGRPFHLFDGFALVNRLLCSAGPQDSSQGRPTPTMFRNCGSHFAATMSILQPTVVISQGRQVSKWVNQVFPCDFIHGHHLHEARMDYGRVLVCTFSHPSSQSATRWGDRLDAPYLTEVVRPTLTEAMALL